MQAVAWTPQNLDTWSEPHKPHRFARFLFPKFKQERTNASLTYLSLDKITSHIVATKYIYTLTSYYKTQQMRVSELKPSAKLGQTLLIVVADFLPMGHGPRKQSSSDYLVKRIKPPKEKRKRKALFIIRDTSITLLYTGLTMFQVLVNCFFFIESTLGVHLNNI